MTKKSKKVKTNKQLKHKAKVTNFKPKEKKKYLCRLAKLYVKDLMIQSPGTPLVFKLKPKFTNEVMLKLTSRRLPDEGYYEVTIGATTTIKAEKKISSIIRLAVSGIFLMNKGLAKEQLGKLLNRSCPDLLIPYVKQHLAKLSMIAGYPPVTFKQESLGMIPRRFVIHTKQKAQEKHKLGN